MFTVTCTEELAGCRAWSQAACKSKPPCVKQQPSSTQILTSRRLVMNFFAYGAPIAVFIRRMNIIRQIEYI